MPIYLFSNPNNENEIIEVVMSVNDKHEYIRNGVKWDRVWCKPQMAVDTKWNPDDPKDFVQKTGSKRGSYGELLDKSKELSEAREKKHGIDPVKEQMYKDYKKTRRKDHPDVRKKKLKEKLKNNKHFDIEI